MSHFLLALYHNIRTRLDLIHLPTLPTSVSRLIDQEFFPVSEDSRYAMRGQMLSREPFSKNSAGQLRRRMTGLGDSGKHLRFIRALYCERKAPLLHEFTIVWYASAEGDKNYFISERHRSSRQRRPQVEALEVIQCEEIIPLPIPRIDGTQTINERINLASSASADAVSRSAQSSSDFISCGSYYADDSISVSHRGIEDDVQKLEGDYIVLAEIHAPENCTLTVAELIVLVSTITDAMPFYKLLETQCFLYSRIFWYMLVKLLRGADPGRDGHIPFSRKNGGGQHISAVKLKNHVAARVTSELKKLNIVAAYESSWQAFTAECQKKREEIDRPLNEALQREKEIRDRQQEAKIRAETAEAEIERLREQLRLAKMQAASRPTHPRPSCPPAATPARYSSPNWSS
ncbi:hypothetical protein B0H14DRAFT_993755 [Mycena olivaceomarginata]|nr:hypothetical protein B0H14DRAFT_993755 [Mycena olivaceomarginata]